MKSFAGKIITFVAGAGLSLSCLHAAETLNGAGASFPAPAYNIWTYNYTKASGVRINYQSVGSGAGIAQIKARTVDFGATDNPLAADELKRANLTQFPMLMGGVVPIINLAGVKADEMKLDADALADIFLGKIVKWNDKKIKELNPQLDLPDEFITTVHRADGSGTTWIFTSYLSKSSPAWAKSVGCNKAVRWPCGVGAQKNPGVAGNVEKTNGAIGYVEYAYALASKLATVQLKNRDGEFVKPTPDTFKAAAANAQWDPAAGFYMELTNQPGKDSWPITGATFILLPDYIESAAKKEALLDYFRWCFREGGPAAAKLQYVTLPGKVVEMVEKSWENIKSNGKH